MFSSKRILPPWHIVTLIIGITVVPLATLTWLGWRLLDQDRILAAQQAQQQVERAADLVVAGLQRALAQSRQRMAVGDEQWPAGAVMLVFHDDQVEAYPASRVAYLPKPPVLREVGDADFARGEQLEFINNDPVAAAKLFQEQAKALDPAIRAGALLRLGRNLSRMGRFRDAMDAYAQLSNVEGVSVGGVPASLIGLDARCELLEQQGRPSQLAIESERLANTMRSGHWSLTGPVYFLYAADIVQWNAGAKASFQDRELFASAAGSLWEQRQELPGSGQATLTMDGRNLAVLWQVSGTSIRALIAAPQFIESEWLPTIAPVLSEQHATFALVDSNNSLLFGVPGAHGAPQATRSARDAELPWGVTVASALQTNQSGGFVLRRRLLISGLALLVFLAMCASYMIFRAVGRELAVARLQSDFVAAVSHEFRTPLTALRQFTDMLREQPRMNDERRRVCYEAQSRATDRLMRLVESLLDFGRMEAGAHHYQFELCDSSALLRNIVDDFRKEARSAGYEIDFEGSGSAQIETDREALSRAVWNLLDNAVKYSPDHHSVEVGLKCGQQDIRIAVQDHGIGIPPHERAGIFSKFQRGEQARTLGIRGTGIGLAMVNEIVKAHRGRIELESEPGKGSTFTIVLPAKDHHGAHPDC